MTYRGLAASDYVKWLGLEGIHYTTIHKAIKRLPNGFLEEAMRILAEMTSNSTITAIVDATIFTLSCYEERIKPQKNAKPRAKGCPAWSEHIRRYKEIGRVIFFYKLHFPKNFYRSFSYYLIMNTVRKVRIRLQWDRCRGGPHYRVCSLQWGSL